jgi:DNA-binding GntR family transcriptional regulator
MNRTMPRPRAVAPSNAEGQSLQKHSLAAVVANAVRQEILSGALAGGEWLRQDALADRFDVSQTMIREAFKQLESEGLLRVEPRRGVRVTVLSADEALEITQLRCLIEPQVLEWAVPNVGKAGFDLARSILDELDQALSVEHIILLNAQFHDALYKPARRERALVILASLRLNFERYLRFTWQETAHLKQSQREHRALLKHCIAGDVEAACKHLARHIEATGTIISNRLHHMQK